MKRLAYESVLPVEVTLLSVPHSVSVAQRRESNALVPSGGERGEVNALLPSGGEGEGVNALVPSGGIKLSEIERTSNTRRELTMRFMLRTILLGSVLMLLCCTRALAVPAAPSISPGYSIFSSGPQAVTMTAGMGEDIYYTSDGSEPDTNSNLYSGSFNISNTTTIKAFANDMSGSSPVTTVHIQIDSDTADVPRSNLLLWLRSDAETVLTSSNAVTDWKDNSGNDNHATQPTAARRPTLNADSLNGHPALTFDTHELILPSGFSDFTDGLSIFIVAKPKLENWFTRLIRFRPSAGSTANSFDIHLYEKTLYFNSVNASSGQSNINSSNSIFPNQPQLIEAVYNGATTATTYVNSMQRATGTVNSIADTTRNSNFLGSDNGGFYFKGDIVEVLVYSYDVTSGERADIEDYINQRYALGSVPPVISPRLGVFTGSTTVTIASMPGSTTYLTTNGVDPTTSDTQYTGAFSLNNTATVKAISVQNFGTSNVDSVFLQIDPKSAGVPRTGLQAWFKADNNAIVDGSDNVLEWKNMASTALHATQATAGDRPALVSNALNSLPSVSFDGSTDFLQMGSGFANFTTGTSVFAVLKPVATVPSDATVFDIGNSGNNDIALTEPTSTGARFHAFSGTTDNYVDASDALAAGQFQVLSILHGTNGIATIFTGEDREGIGILSNSSNTTRANNFIGKFHNSTGFFKGEIAELLIYNRIVTESEKNAIRGYLFERYQLGVSAPMISIPTSVINAAPKSITLSADPGAEIRYTLDGSTPSGSSTLFSAPFNITDSKVVKAIAIQSFGTSAVATSDIRADLKSKPITRDGLVLWLREFGIEESGGDVSKWTDYSGLRNDATQATGANQPELVEDAANGFPTVKFDGSDHFLDLPLLSSNFSQGVTIFAVTKPTSLSSGATLLDLGNGATDNNIRLAEPNGSGDLRFHVFNGSTDFNLTATSVLTAGQFDLHEVYQSSSTATMLKNGVQEAQGTTASIPNVIRSSNFLGQRGGATNRFPGELAELLVFNRALTTSERLAVESALIGKFQLLSQAPAAPVISDATSTLTEPTQVVVSADSEAEIHITTDGSTPTAMSPTYDKPLNIYFTQTLKAIAIKNGISSGVSSATYTLNSTNWPAPDPMDMTQLEIDIKLPPQAVPQ